MLKDKLSIDLKQFQVVADTDRHSKTSDGISVRLWIKQETSVGVWMTIEEVNALIDALCEAEEFVIRG